MVVVTSEHVKLKVTFRSKNTKDNEKWIGYISGIIDYNVAKNFGDVLSYNTLVSHSDNTVPSVDLLNYFLITLISDTNQIKVFASEWILDGSFEILEEKVLKKIGVYDYDANSIQDVIDYLKAGGWSAKEL